MLCHLIRCGYSLLRADLWSTAAAAVALDDAGLNVLGTDVYVRTNEGRYRLVLLG